MARPPIINLRSEDYKDIEQPSFKRLISTINEFGKQVNNGLNSKLTVTDNLNGFYVTVKIVIQKSLSPMPPRHIHIGDECQYGAGFSPKAGYAEFAAFAHDNNVTITGVAVAAAGNGKLLTTLPLGLRPKYKTKWETGAAPVVEIDVDGRVLVANTAGATYIGDVTLGKSFEAEDSFLSTHPFSQTYLKAFPFKIKNDLLNKSKPSAIIVANSFEIVNQGKEPAGLAGVSYRPVGADIEIDYIGGVHDGDAYEVTLLVLGD